MKLVLSLLLGMGLLNFNSSFKKLYILYVFLGSYLFMSTSIINNSIWVKINWIFSVDFYGLYLLIMSFWIMGIMELVKKDSLMQFMCLILMMSLLLSFGTLNMLILYFMFEFSLLPIFFLIQFKGYSYERFESMMYMLFFTIIMSIPFMMVMMSMYNKLGSLMMVSLMNYSLNEVKLFFLLLMFLVKVPMFIIHIWLPKAHVEAPVYGSMILAGVLLKLGTYGVLRMILLFYENIYFMSNYFIVISLVGGVMMSMYCLIQVDMKMLVAYSSIVHMMMLMGSMFTMSKLGLVGAYMMMIGHGLCSSGLFFIVNLSYIYSNSRLLMLNKGFMSVNSNLSLWWFLLCSSNFSAPISLSLMGEMLMLMSLYSWDLILLPFLIMMSFFCSVYSLYLFSYTQHGELNYMLNKYMSVKVIDYLILFFHWFPLNMLFIGLGLFMV
uniref:NADH-ubiquinone oxidoreductase chain 4 n=1 Tax=Abispa ephippium TaxID=485912 RepID=B6RQY7_9HYME|nr:NADH dehydrogenase subunit 4 [Abispa ephippium]